MMDVRIGSVNSHIQTTDSRSLLSPQLLDQITLAVIERLRDEHEREQRAEADRRLRPGVFSEEPWS